MLFFFENSRDVTDTTLPDSDLMDTGEQQLATSKFKHKSWRMKWEYYCQCSLQLKFKQNMYVFPLI